jgi:hypothetical protein
MPVLFEYGTLNSQTTMGSLKSIHTMILENQGTQHGYKSERDSLRVKNPIFWRCIIRHPKTGVTILWSKPGRFLM